MRRFHTHASCGDAAELGQPTNVETEDALRVLILVPLLQLGAR